MEKKKKVAVLAQGVGGYHSGPFNLYKFISELKYLTFFWVKAYRLILTKSFDAVRVAMIF